MIIIDKFLPTYSALKDYSKTCKFEDEFNPVDGVVYPLICKDIPAEIKSDIETRLSIFMRKLIINPVMFMRMSPKGAPYPRIYHNDSSMGAYSFMLYLEDNKDAGTGFYKYVTGDVRPNDAILQDVITDCNNHSEWLLEKKADMRENRGVLFDSSLFHAALPFGGYGDTQENSRIVLTVFFS